MWALARITESCLDLIRGGGSGKPRVTRVASVLAAAVIVGAMLWFSVLRTSYRLDLGS